MAGGPHDILPKTGCATSRFVLRCGHRAYARPFLPIPADTTERPSLPAGPSPSTNNKQPATSNQQPATSNLLHLPAAKNMRRMRHRRTSPQRRRHDRRLRRRVENLAPNLKHPSLLWCRDDGQKVAPVPSHDCPPTPSGWTWPPLPAPARLWNKLQRSVCCVSHYFTVNLSTTRS